MRDSKDIIKDIVQFEPQDGEWLELDSLLNELWDTGDQENFTTELLTVFERFLKKMVPCILEYPPWHRRFQHL